MSSMEGHSWQQSYLQKLMGPKEVTSSKTECAKAMLEVGWLKNQDNSNSPYTKQGKGNTHRGLGRTFGKTYWCLQDSRQGQTVVLLPTLPEVTLTSDTNNVTPVQLDEVPEPGAKPWCASTSIGHHSTRSHRCHRILCWEQERKCVLPDCYDLHQQVARSLCNPYPRSINGGGCPRNQHSLLWSPKKSVQQAGPEFQALILEEGNAVPGHKQDTCSQMAR